MASLKIQKITNYNIMNADETYFKISFAIFAIGFLMNFTYTIKCLRKHQEDRSLKTVSFNRKLTL